MRAGAATAGFSLQVLRPISPASRAVRHELTQLRTLDTRHPGVSVVIDELSQGPCPPRGLVNLSVVVSPGSLFLQLRGIDMRDGTIQESWRQTSAFTVQEFPPSQQSSHTSNDDDVAPCVQNSSVTIVTASILIEPNRHDFTRGLRSILNLGCPTVVYGDAAAAAAIRLHRQLHPQQPIELIPVSVDDLQAWRHYDALSQRATPSFCRLINWTSQHALYLAIVLLKPVWLLQTATTNAFETEKVLWLDASPRCLGFLSPPLLLDKPQFKELRGTVHIH
jgi:hypothetical protein